MPRVDVARSAAARPDQRWATDIALVHCGIDGWCASVPVIDGCTREVMGWELDRSWRAKTAERALETALINRFGYTRGAPEGLVLRHDNGLVFGGRGHIASARDYGPTQEFITPSTPQENGLCERVIRTIKQECVSQRRFESVDEESARSRGGSSGTTRGGRTRRWATPGRAGRPSVTARSKPRRSRTDCSWFIPQARPHSPAGAGAELMWALGETVIGVV